MENSPPTDSFEELEVESESLQSDILSSLIGIPMKSFGAFMEYLGSIILLKIHLEFDNLSHLLARSHSAVKRLRPKPPWDHLHKMKQFYTSPMVMFWHRLDNALPFKHTLCQICNNLCGPDNILSQNNLIRLFSVWHNMYGFWGE